MCKDTEISKCKDTATQGYKDKEMHWLYTEMQRFRNEKKIDNRDISDIKGNSDTVITDTDITNPGNLPGLQIQILLILVIYQDYEYRYY